MIRYTQFSLMPPKSSVSAHTVSFWERWALRQAHPVAIIFRSIGMLWAFYYLWQNDLPMVLATMLISQVIAQLSTLHLNYESLGQSLWGRIALLHLHPINVMTQLIGVMLGAVGFWWHDTTAILTAVYLILLGNAYGWRQVHECLYLHVCDS